MSLINKKKDSGEKALNEINLILKKYNLRMDYKLTFPIYKQLPYELQLALKIIVKHGMEINAILNPK